MVDRYDLNRMAAIKLIPLGYVRHVGIGQVPTQSTHENVVPEGAKTVVHGSWHVVKTACEDGWHGLS
uniref:hypothetical protein n=1 Tax=Enterobacter agglomerans TaxID=549 RepID=UPI00223ACD78